MQLLHARVNASQSKRRRTFTRFAPCPSGTYNKGVSPNERGAQ